MPDLTFSLTPTDAVAEDALRPLLDNHERRTHTRVHLHKTTPQSAQQDLNSFALYKMGADVSQMGSTWLRGFIDMNALRPFNALEINRMGNASQYVPACWESAHLPNQAQSACWAIPWLADVRVLYYRRAGWPTNLTLPVEFTAETPSSQRFLSVFWAFSAANH